MTPTDLRATLTRLGLSQVGAAKVLGVNDRTVRRWIAGDLEIPNPAALALHLIEKHKFDPWKAAELLRDPRK